jgi:hypothetical protein
MTLFKRYRTLILAVVIIAIAFFAYSYFFADKGQPILSEQAPAAETPVDQDLIALLLQLRSIRLDTAIFNDPAFRSLQDFSQALVPEAIGRTNPFAPLGARLAPATQTQTPR